MHHVVLFATAVFVGQVIEGTNVAFAVLTATYTLLWAKAFNVAGGIRYPSGAFIFFNGFISVIIGLGFKVLLGQPGERNLHVPITTMSCYCIGMAALLVAAFLCRGLRREVGFLPGFDSLAGMRQAAIICLLCGIFIMPLIALGGSSPIISALRQINKMPTMAIMLATTYEVRRSGGKRAVNWIVVTAVGFSFVVGLISFGKEGMLIGFVAWFFAAVLQGYDFKPQQLVVSALAMAFFVYYLVPYSQYVRNFHGATFAENEAVALHYLSDLGETRRLYEDGIAAYDITDEFHLYDKREAFMDRLIVIPADDALIEYTDRGNVYGLSPTVLAYSNLVPRIIWQNKPTGNTGNSYGHEIGILADEDATTGIAFSATADAYHQAKWLGLLLLLPVDLFLYFIIFDSIVGSAKSAPWALIPILDLSEIGPDGGLDGPIYSMTYGIFAILVIFWIVKYLAPLIMRTSRRGNFAKVNSPLRRMSPSLHRSVTIPAPTSDRNTHV